jgi:long-chain fatty acid transport protein
MKKRIHSVVGTLLSLSMASQAFALGTGSYSSEIISARSLGEGGTGVSGAQDDPIAAYTNPAGMTAIKGTQVTVGMSYVNASPTFTDDAGDVSGARATSVVIPNFGVTTQLLDGKLSFGLAAVTPYGLETHFDGDSPIRYSATDSRLRLIDVSPAVAYKVCDAFSIGVGADYYNALEGALSKKVDSANLNGQLTYAGILGGGGTQGAALAGAAAAAAASTDADSRLNGNGDGWGYHIGTTITPNEHHQIGIVYHSSVKIGLTGNVQLTGLNGAATSVFGGSNFQTSATAPLYMPQNVQIGYAYKPNDRLQIDVDAAWYDWYSARQLGVVYSGLTAAQNQVLQSGNPEVFNPRKTINFGFGANYKANDRLQVRGGAYYEAASTPESAFAPAFVDLPRYALTIGAGYQLTNDLSFDVAYNAIFFHTRHIDDPNTATFGGSNGYSGSFDSFANLISANAKYRFDTHF